MTNTISIDEWLDVTAREYLSTFIRQGGSTVKFAIAGEETRAVLGGKLEARGKELGYVVLTLDAAACRVHMPQDIFFALSSQLDWRLLARKLILRILHEKGYGIEGVDPESPANIVASIARANGLEAPFVVTELRPLLQERVWKDPKLARAVRVAMTHLCRMEMEAPGQGDYAGQALLDWLTGTDRRIGHVRHYQIHTPVNRTTARYFIESALYCVRLAGFPGSIIVLDNTRVTLPRNPKDGLRYYTKAMTMDHYEVLREFIDDVDRLSGSFLLLVTDETFVDEHAPRGWALYAALRTRVMDDVRDRNIANPVASLVRLS